MPQITIEQAIQLAIRHQQQGRLADAEALCGQILKVNPNHPDALHLAGVLAGQHGRSQMAIDLIGRAVAVNPCAEYRFNLGVALADAGHSDRAVDEYRAVLKLQPNHVAASINVANLLTLQGRLDEAAGASIRAIELDPGNAKAYNNLANVRKDQGLLDEALACYDRAIALAPADPVFHSNRVYLLHFHPAYDSGAIYAEHREWNRRHGAHLKPAGDVKKIDAGARRDPGRRLKIGYVSPNFRIHPVGRFLLPLLESHDHAGFEIFCYSDVRRPDALTARFRNLAETWRETARLSDEQLAELVRHDGIDILVDLTMHMADNRLLTFARKPAPVQVTYLAYCSTTGLDTIDFRFTDNHLDSPEELDGMYSEKSVRLPETYWCYNPGLATPEPGPLPALSAGKITFGCLNTFSKTSPATLLCWCEILRKVPQSRLLLHAKEGSHRQRVIDVLRNQNVDPDRLGFVGFLPGEDYFRLYQGIDIALDPFPCAGGTTTCDALWMGVPVVTLAGTTAVSRAGVSILSNVRLTGLIARTQDEYVTLASELAADLSRLAGIRAGLRQRMQKSELMDAQRFARNVEAEYRAMRP